MQFQNEMNRQISEIMIALQRGKSPNYSFVKVHNRELMNCIQKSPSRKYYLDIDCDTKNAHVLFTITGMLNTHGIKYHMIETHGGCHFLISPEDLKMVSCKWFNISLLLQEAKEVAGGSW